MALKLRVGLTHNARVLLQSEFFESLRQDIRQEDWELERQWLAADVNKDGVCSFEEFVQYYNSMVLLRLENEGSPPRTRTVRHHSSLDENDDFADDQEQYTSFGASIPRSSSAMSFEGADGLLGAGGGSGAAAATLSSPVSLTIDANAANEEASGALAMPPPVVKMVTKREETPFFIQAANRSQHQRLTPLASPFRKRRKSAVMNHFHQFKGFARPPVAQRQNGGKRPLGSGFTLKVRGSGRDLR